jgi:hypothetical protein
MKGNRTRIRIDNISEVREALGLPDTEQIKSLNEQIAEANKILTNLLTRKDDKKNKKENVEIVDKD